MKLATPYLRSRHLIELFLKMNADLIINIPYYNSTLFEYIQKTMTKLETKLSDTNEILYDILIGKIFEILGNQKIFPVIYLFDEHNELFKENLLNDIFLRNFKTWTGITSGVRNINLFLFILYRLEQQLFILVLLILNLNLIFLMENNIVYVI